MTSNLITRENKGDMMNVLKSFFKPEFLNRLDEIILFKPLNKENLRKIVDIQTARLQKRLLGRQIKLNIEDSARDWLAQNGYDAEFGARPLKRLIVQDLENPLALKLLDGEIKDGDTVRIFADAEGLKIN
jgi:ATP-dependent Clp protease ATP-binding subunit ClpB